MRRFLQELLKIFLLLFLLILVINILKGGSAQNAGRNSLKEEYTISHLVIGTQEIAFRPFLVNPNNPRATMLYPEQKEYILQLAPKYFGDEGVSLFEPARTFTELGIKPRIYLKSSTGEKYDLFPQNIFFEWRRKSKEDPLYLQYAKSSTPFPLVRFVVEPTSIGQSLIGLSCLPDACFPPLVNHLAFQLPIRILEIIEFTPQNKKAA